MQRRKFGMETTSGSRNFSPRPCRKMKFPSTWKIPGTRREFTFPRRMKSGRGKSCAKLWKPRRRAEFRGLPARSKLQRDHVLSVMQGGVPARIFDLQRLPHTTRYNASGSGGRRSGSFVDLRCPIDVLADH